MVRTKNPTQRARNQDASSSQQPSSSSQPPQRDENGFPFPGGPIDDSVLKEYPTHVARKIWESREAWICLYFPSLYHDMAEIREDFHFDEPMAMGLDSASSTRTMADYIGIRKMLDSKYKVEKVVWDPYGNAGISDIAYFRGILFCQDLCTPYLPDRVVRQFGFLQQIPVVPVPLPTTRGSKNIKLSFSYKTLSHFQDHWVSYLINGVNHSPLILANPPNAASDDYLAWFYRVSHPIVTPPAQIGPNDHIWNASVLNAVSYIDKALDGRSAKEKKARPTGITAAIIKVRDYLMSIPCLNTDVVSGAHSSRPSSTALVIREPTGSVPPMAQEDDEDTEDEDETQIHTRGKRRRD